MKTRIVSTSAALGIVMTLAPLFLVNSRALGEDRPELVQIDTGTAAFDAATNISAISVHGKSTALKARVRLHKGAEGLVIEDVQAWLPVKTLMTGMGVRDEHMRKYVFTTANGDVPDLRFAGEKLSCPTAQKRDAVCKVAGKLSIRGVERPFAIALKVREEGGGTPSYRAAGDGIVKLSDYSIERPSQFGVKTENEVKLHLEFSGTAVAESAGNGGRQ